MLSMIRVGSEPTIRSVRCMNQYFFALAVVLLSLFLVCNNVYVYRSTEATMRSSANSNVGDDDLICPITRQVFHSPVVATDGHTYERSAIVRWITEHGTSPITRQPLHVNELQEDDYLKNMVIRHQRATESIVGVKNDANNDELISPMNTYLKTMAAQQQTSTISHNSNMNVDQIVLGPIPTMSDKKITSIRDVEDPHVSRHGFCLRRRCWIPTVAMLMIVSIATASMYGIACETSIWMLLLSIFGLVGSSYCLLMSLCVVVGLLCHDVENRARIRDAERQARYEHSSPNANATIVALSTAYSNFESNRKVRYAFR